MSFSHPSKGYAETQTKEIEGLVLDYIRLHPGTYYSEMKDVLYKRPDAKRISHKTLERALERLVQDSKLRTVHLERKRIGFYVNDYPGSVGNGKVIADYLDSIDEILVGMESKYKELTLDQKRHIAVTLVKGLCNIQSGLRIYPDLKFNLSIERLSYLQKRIKEQLKLLVQIISSDESMEKVEDEPEYSFSQSEVIKSAILFDLIKIKKEQNDEIKKMLC